LDENLEEANNSPSSEGSNLHDDMINDFMDASLSGERERIEDTYQYYLKKIPSDSEKHIKEITEDFNSKKKELEDAEGISDDTRSREVAKLDEDLKDEIESEKFFVEKSYNELNQEYTEALEKVSEQDGMEKSENDEKKMPQPENENKQSPLDYVLEKKDCEMPGLSDSNIEE
jgi:cell division protein ZapA (FtsZ GTPase activity inhibitor)